MKKNYIGVMSGTSLDGVDIVLCSILDKKCKLLYSHEYPFDKKLKKDILKTIKSSTTLKEIAKIDKRLAMLYAKSINHFIDKNDIDRSSIEAIGLHGQTLWHQPDGRYPFSMQLGDANSVVVETGIKVINNFRGMDVASGGEGAPFAPAFHKFLFGTKKKKRAVVNIGGMANITFLQKPLIGWDTGCGNILMDTYIKLSQNKEYDKDGSFAKSGVLDKKLLKQFCMDKYFKKLPPKSTGREYFNESWLMNYIKNSKSSSADIQRTLLELTAKTIANDINSFDLDELIVCGGGVKNKFLMQRLCALCKCEVFSSDDFGVSSDFMEAMAFAWLAYKRVNNQKVKLKHVTGAKQNNLLGAIYG
jgi:anhydro-N-acetylmuramic acid kinase